jgi:hypothetical protein
MGASACIATKESAAILRHALIDMAIVFYCLAVEAILREGGRWILLLYRSTLLRA